MPVLPARRRLLRPVLVLAWTALVGLGVGLIERGQGRAEREAHAQLGERAELSAEVVHAYVAELVRGQASEAMGQLTGAAPDRALAGVVRERGLRTGAVLDARGRVLAAWPSSRLVGRRMGWDDPHVASALGGVPAVSGVVASAITGRPVVAVAVPFPAPEGRRVLTAGLDPGATALATYLSGTLSAPGIRPWLVDGTGTLIAGQGVRADRAEPMRRRDPALARALARSRAGTLPDGRAFAARDVAGTPWRLALVAPSAAIGVPGGLRKWLPWVAWLTLAGATLGLLLLVDRLVRARAELEHEHAEAETVRRAGAEAEARFRTAFDHAPVGMALVAPDGRFLRVNEALCELVGRTVPELLRTDFQALTHPEDLHADVELVERVLDGELREYAMEKRYVRPDGEVVWAELSVALVRDDDGRPLHFVSQVQDVTDRRRFAEQLSDLANKDPLTGLWTRRRFAEALEQQVARCRRYGETAALLLIDLDHFKEVNDTFGHKVGDDLLEAVAGVMRQRLRETDAVARLGGDEFAVLLTSLTPDDAAAVAQDLRERIGGCEVRVEGEVVSAGASVGVAFLDETTASDQGALVAADLAMYDAKAAGRDRHGAITVSETPSPAGHGLRLSQRLRKALDEDALVLHAQPIIDLETGGVALYELLVRMLDDQGAVVAPGQFLPVAERFGFISSIDRWVIGKAAREQAAWARRGREVTLSVNLSGRSVCDPQLPVFIEQAIVSAGADPASLVFELTETEAIANMGQARALVDHLSALGCRTALDDFGAGFASFAYLKNLPVDLLKVDGEFVRDLDTNRDSRLLLGALLDVARAMGKTTVAEWVATPRIEQVVRELGIELGQGFALGRPAPLAELLDSGPVTDREPAQAPAAAPAVRAVRVLHCDDSAPYRALVRAMLSTREDVELVGEVETHAGAIEATARLRPDVVLLDAGTHDHLVDVAVQLHAVSPRTRVVVLSGHRPEDLPVPGHDGWLRKSAGADELLAAIRPSGGTPAPVPA